MKTIIIQVPDDYEIQIIKKEKPIIRTYQDLIDNKVVLNNYYYIGSDSNIYKGNSYIAHSRNMTISEKVTKSMLAMAMISQLMPYYGGEITAEEWDDAHIKKYTINNYRNKIDLAIYLHFYYFLAFHTEQQRDEFLKYNKQLVKDYLMII